MTKFGIDFPIRQRNGITLSIIALVVVYAKYCETDQSLYRFVFSEQ